MHTIKLNVQDSIYSHIMFLLNSLNTKELEIVEDKTINIPMEDNFDIVFDAVNLDMKDFKFDREEANAR
jgi:hypothetical protein